MKSGIVVALLLAFAPLSAHADFQCPTTAQVKVDAVGSLPNGRYVNPLPSKVLTGDPEETIEFTGMRITYLDPRRPERGSYAKIKCEYKVTIAPPGRGKKLLAAIGDIKDVVRSRKSLDQVKNNDAFEPKPKGNPHRYYCKEKLAAGCVFWKKDR